MQAVLNLGLVNAARGNARRMAAAAAASGGSGSSSSSDPGAADERRAKSQIVSGALFVQVMSVVNEDS